MIYSHQWFVLNNCDALFVCWKRKIFGLVAISFLLRFFFSGCQRQKFYRWFTCFTVHFTWKYLFGSFLSRAFFLPLRIKHVTSFNILWVDALPWNCSFFPGRGYWTVGIKLSFNGNEPQIPFDEPHKIYENLILFEKKFKRQTKFTEYSNSK